MSLVDDTSDQIKSPHSGWQPFSEALTEQNLSQQQLEAWHDALFMPEVLHPWMDHRIGWKTNVRYTIPILRDFLLAHLRTVGEMRSWLVKATTQLKENRSKRTLKVFIYAFVQFACTGTPHGVTALDLAKELGNKAGSIALDKTGAREAKSAAAFKERLEGEYNMAMLRYLNANPL